jgi:hypothetical protein
MMEGFTALDIRLEGDGAFRDEPHAKHGRLDRVATLADGTTKGKPSVAIGIRLDNGEYVIAETTWNLLYTAARAIEARYGPAT